MLAISRRANQGVVVEGNIRIRILSVRGNVVRVGIDAPKSVNVRREELPPRAEVAPKQPVT